MDELHGVMAPPTPAWCVSGNVSSEQTEFEVLDRPVPRRTAAEKREAEKEFRAQSIADDAKPLTEDQSQVLDVLLDEYTYRELQSEAQQLGVAAKGTAKQVASRIARVMMPE